MNVKKKVGIIALAVGSVVLVLSLVADLIGIGSGPGSGFGGLQTAGTVVGACVVAVALLMTFKK